MHIPIPIPFLALLLLPLTTALILSARPGTRLKCDVAPALPVSSGDCVVLLAYLNAQPWFSHPITYGSTQTGPGRTPFNLVHDTCRFYLFANNEAAVETMTLVRYLKDMERVVHECLEGRLYSNGEVLMGHSKNFFTYLGGAVPRNGTERVVVRV